MNACIASTSPHQFQHQAPYVVSDEFSSSDPFQLFPSTVQAAVFTPKVGTFGQIWVHNTVPDQPKSLAAHTLLVLTAVFTIHTLDLYQGCLLSELVKEPERTVRIPGRRLVLLFAKHSIKYYLNK